MMTQEQAKTALAKCGAKIDFFEELTARLADMIDEVEMARHDNVLWQFGEDWTLAENVSEFWDASETAREGIGRLRWLCDDQLTRERNKAQKLDAYVTRLESQAISAAVTETNTADADDDANRDFDETQINFVDDEDRLNYLSELEPFKAEFVAALRGVYLDTAGYFDEEIIPAVDWAEMMAPMYATDHSTTAYRKNADGTFTEDADAYKRIREIEMKMARFSNPELDEAQAETEVTSQDAEEEEFKLYPIDLAIYHGGDTLSDEELQGYAAQLRKAITANGNFGEVEIEESYLSVSGDTGGDNKTIWKIVGDLCWRGECCLESYDAEWPHELREMPGNEIDALLKRMGIDDTPETPETKETLREKRYALLDEQQDIDVDILSVKKAISELKDGQRWLRETGCDAQISAIDAVVDKLNRRIEALTDERKAINAKIDNAKEKARTC